MLGRAVQVASRVALHIDVTIAVQYAAYCAEGSPFQMEESADVILVPEDLGRLATAVALSIGVASLSALAQAGSTGPVAPAHKPKPTPSPSVSPRPTATPTPTPGAAPSQTASPSPWPLPGSWKDVPSKSLPSGVSSSQNQTLPGLAMISAALRGPATHCQPDPVSFVPVRSAGSTR
jgi:hypothetical protein